jgi:putative sporulation protein YtaF
MPPIVSLLILALAVSLDGFGVGTMYGLRKIKIPLFSVVIIALCSGIVILVSMRIGVWLSAMVSPTTAKDVGAVILVGIGIWAIFQLLLQKDENAKPDHPPVPVTPVGEVTGRTVLSIEIKRLGLVVKIMRRPPMADVDKSGIISASEAALLGLALSLDAFGAGIGAAMIGFQPALTALTIAFSSGAFISAGLRVGFRFADLHWVRRLSILPGCILIMMGLLKLM